MTEITRAPPRLSGIVALLAGVSSLLGSAVGGYGAGVSGTAQTALFAAGALGLVALAAGAFRGVRRYVTLGGVGLFAAVLVAGVGARGLAPSPPLLLGFVGAAVAWDVGEHGVVVGEQLGRETDTARLVVVHAAASLVVGAFAAGLGYGVFAAATGGQPVSALVLLLVGLLALVAAVRR